jgi:hypothetical protein
LDLNLILLAYQRLIHCLTNRRIQGREVFMTERIAIAVCWLLFTGLLAAHPAQAELQGSLALSGQDFYYKELDEDDVLFDTEDGALPGLQAGLYWRRPDRFVETELVSHVGWVDYWSPKGTSETHERILDWNVLAGLPLAQFPQSHIEGYAGLGYRDWRRGIKSTDLVGLVEKYRWWYLQLGLRAQETVADGTRFGVDARLLRPLDPELDVHFNDLYTDITLHPEERFGYRVALQVERDLQSGMILWISPWLEVWELDASSAVDLYGVDAPSQPTGDKAHEPDSKTRSAGLMLGLRWRL